MSFVPTQTTAPAAGTTPSDSDKSPLVSRARQLLSYLEALHRLRHPPEPDGLAGEIVLAPGLPDHPAVRLHPADGVLLEVDRIEQPHLLEVPDQLAAWVDWANPDQRPRLRDSGTDLHEAHRAAFDEWLNAVWAPWRDQIEPELVTRRLFLRLFDHRLVAERDLATHETVWVYGAAIGPAAREHSSRLPLFVTPARYEIDSRTGTLRVLASGATSLEIDAFERLIDTFGLVKEIHNELLGFPPDAVLDDEPEGDGDEVSNDGDDTGSPLPANVLQEEVLERVSKVIADARYLPAADALPPAIGHWQIADIEGIFHRRRPVHYEAYFKALGRAIDVGYLPDTWSAIVADEPTTAPISRTTGAGGTDWASLDQRILSPLPLNEQQLSVLTRIAHNAGVTVQGPPGTGKSYTIAALTSHFLTHGLRVLICAEKPQPLRVIRDKMPDELRELCVAVLGDDRAARQQLEASIAAITAKVNGVDPDRDQRRLDEIDDQLDQVRRQLAELRNRELEIRQAEQRTLSIGGEQIGVAEAARIVTNDESRNGWLPDQLTQATPLPLDNSELTELIHLTHTLAPEDRSTHGPPLCPLDRLFDAPTLIGTWNRFDQAQAMTEAAATRVDLIAAERVGRERLKTLDDHVRRHRDQVQWATRAAWAPIHHAMSASATQRQRWQQLIVHMTTEAAEATRLGLHLAAHDVDVPSAIDGADIGPLLQDLRDRFTNGKGLPRLGGGELKKLVEAISINGRRPSTIDDLDLVDTVLARNEHRRRLVTLWTNELGPFGLPPLDLARPEDNYQTQYQGSLDTLLAIPDRSGELNERLTALLYGSPDLGTPEGIDVVLHGLAAAAAVFDKVDLGQWLDSYAQYFEQATPTGHRSVRTLHEALLNRDATAWQAAVEESHRLHELAPRLARHADLVDRLAAAAPQLAAEYRGRTPTYSVEQLRAAWRWRQLRHWVDEIVGLGDLAAISARISEAERQEQRLVTQVVSHKAWLEMARRTTGAQRSALATWAQAMRRVGKGTGKHAPRHRLVAQHAMQNAQNAVPVWIMSIAQAIESFRPGEQTAFDVVIIDEASQAPLDAMAVLGLGQRVLVVGDDKQISPTTIIDETEANHLHRQHLLDIPDADAFDIRTSLYDTATRRFPGVIQLREHFRCLPEIIAFSNDLSYEGRIDPLREHHPDPDWQPVRAERVPDGYRNGRINQPEIDTIIELVQKLIADPALAPGPDYEDGATIGIVSMLGNEQAQAIQGRLIETIPVSEIEARRIRIGSPYEFQGDERDVIIISMVDAVTAEQRVSGRAASDGPSQQRYNVAASRARDQLIVVHSFDPGQLGETDLRRRLVSFAQNPQRTSQATADLRARCESAFERDILERLLTLGLRVDAQHRVAGYRIDFTVTDLNGRRVAIECDGDSFHGIDQLRADTDRQRILERLGWHFARIRASEYYADTERSFEALLNRVRDHGLQLDYTGSPDPQAMPSQ